QLYLYIMLLASSGVRNINTDEIAALGELLKDWIKQVSMHKLDENSSHPVLCIDPLKLNTPVFSTQLEDRNSKTLFCLDLGKLSEKLQRSHLHQKFVHNIRYSLSPWTADKINHNWTTFVARNQPRYSDDQPKE